MTECAATAISGQERAVVSKCQLLFFIIGERVIEETTIETQCAIAAVRALGETVQPELDSTLRPTPSAGDRLSCDCSGESASSTSRSYSLAKTGVVHRAGLEVRPGPPVLRLHPIRDAARPAAPAGAGQVPVACPDMGVFAVNLPYVVSILIAPILPDFPFHRQLPNALF